MSISSKSNYSQQNQQTTLSSTYLPNNGLTISVTFIFICTIIYFSYKLGLKKGKQITESQLNHNFNQIKEINTILMHENIKSAQAIKHLCKDLQNSFQDHTITPKGYALISVNKEECIFHTTSDGYLMRVESKLDHRYTAEFVLGRSLSANEVVHHIYTIDKTNNKPQNLCVMDRDDHDLFHTYLNREKELKNKYPTTYLQRDLLKSKFGGILLDEALEKKTCYYKPIPTSRNS